MDAALGQIAIISGLIVGRHVDAGIEYVRIKGIGFEASDQTALVPLAWVGEVIAPKGTVND